MEESNVLKRIRIDLDYMENIEYSIIKNEYKGIIWKEHGGASWYLEIDVKYYGYPICTIDLNFHDDTLDEDGNIINHAGMDVHISEMGDTLHSVSGLIEHTIRISKEKEEEAKRYRRGKILNKLLT